MDTTVRPDFGDRLRPGPTIPETMPAQAQGTGQADGVLYWTGVKDRHGQTVLPSKFREALRYLRPQTPMWLATHPEARGRCHPDVWPIRNLEHNQTVSAEIDRLTTEAGQCIAHTFVTCDRAIHALQPAHLTHWWIVPTETEGVWAVFFA